MPLRIPDNPSANNAEEVCELSAAFVHGSTLADAAAAAGHDIRRWCYAFRSALLTGPKIKVTIGNEVVCYAPKALLEAVSLNFAAICDNDLIALPKDTDKMAVDYFLKHLEIVASQAGSTMYMHHSLDNSTAVCICRLGRLFGAEMYTDHIHKAMVQHMHTTHLPGFDVIDVVLAAADNISEFTDIVIFKLARASRRGMKCDFEVLDQFLNDRPALKAAVKVANKRHMKRFRSKMVQIERRKNKDAPRRATSAAAEENGK